jgi:hypothetical protein
VWIEAVEALPAALRAFVVATAFAVAVGRAPPNGAVFASDAVPWAALRPGSIQVTLSSDRAVSTRGQTVVLTLRIANVANEQVRVWRLNAHMDFDLEVHDATGRLVIPDGERAGGLPPHHALFLRPGTSYLESDALTEWGYSLEPGRYRIRAALRLVADPHARSNQIWVKVSPSPSLVPWTRGNSVPSPSS